MNPAPFAALPGRWTARRFHLATRLFTMCAPNVLNAKRKGHWHIHAKKPLNYGMKGNIMTIVYDIQLAKNGELRVNGRDWNALTWPVQREAREVIENVNIGETVPLADYLALEEEFHGAENTADDLDGRMSELEAEIEGMEYDIDHARSQIAELQSLVKVAKEKKLDVLDNIEKRLADLMLTLPIVERRD